MFLGYLTYCNSRRGKRPTPLTLNRFRLLYGFKWSIIHRLHRQSMWVRVYTRVCVCAYARLLTPDPLILINPNKKDRTVLSGRRLSGRPLVVVGLVFDRIWVVWEIGDKGSVYLFNLVNNLVCVFYLGTFNEVEIFSISGLEKWIDLNFRSSKIPSYIFLYLTRTLRHHQP